LNKLIKRYVSEEDEAKLIKIKSKNGCTTFWGIWGCYKQLCLMKYKAANLLCTVIYNRIE
jgi:hypothetical protein